VKRVILAVLLAAGAAQAAEIKGGVGLTRFGAQPNGTWYQQEYPHKLHLTSPSFKLGLTDTYGSTRWHVGAEWVGKYGSQAEAKASDYAYFGKTEYPLSHWVGTGRAAGLYAMAGPEYQLGSWTIHPQAGVYAYRASWTMHIPDWRPCADGAADHPGCTAGTPRPLTVSSTAKTSYTPVLGLSVAQGRWSVDLSGRQVMSHGEFPSITRGVAWNVSISRRF